MPRRSVIPAHDGGAKPTGSERRRVAEGKRLSENTLYKYRPYFVSGRVELAELAGIIADDLGIDEATDRTKVLRRLAYFAQARGWHELRKLYQDQLASAVEVRMSEEAAEEYMGRLRKAGDSLLEQGMIYVGALAPMSMPEALDMVRAGKELGLRGRNMPEKVTGTSSVNIGTMNVNTQLLNTIQELPKGDYAALAGALDAAFTESVAGRTLAEGRPVAVGTDPEREPPAAG